MKLLLDTHALLWATFDSDKLSATVREQTADPENLVMVSAVSFWELSLKYALGKINLSVSPERIVTMTEKIGVDIVHPGIAEYATIHNLSLVDNHKDPFDRIIIWQAIKNDWTLVSRDSYFHAY